MDNFTFKLFYKWSVSLFIAGSVVVVSSQFFGEPISCETVSQMVMWVTDSHDGIIFQADDSVDEEVLNHYCWMFSQFDIPPDFKVSWQLFVARKVLGRKHNMNGRFPFQLINKECRSGCSLVSDPYSDISLKYWALRYLTLFRISSSWWRWERFLLLIKCHNFVGDSEPSCQMNNVLNLVRDTAPGEHSTAPTFTTHTTSGSPSFLWHRYSYSLFIIAAF